MGKVREWTGVKGQREAVREAGNIQQAMGEQAIERQDAALQQILGIQRPFVQAGEQAIGGLLGAILGGAPESVPARGGFSARFKGRDRRAPGVTIDGDADGLEFVDEDFAFERGAERVTQDPFFQALAEQQEERLLGSAAARGMVGSGRTGAALSRNLLRLGQEFRQQDIANQIQEAQIQQGLRAENLGRQAQRFGQLLNVSQLGANVSTGSGSAIQGAAANVGNLLTGIGNVQAGTTMQRANLSAGATQGMLGLAGGVGAGALGGSMGLFGEDIGAGGGALLGILSDIRAKENIVAIGRDTDGVMVYEYNYKNDEAVYRGKMAQDIQRVDPNHVQEGADGLLYVSEKYRPQKVA